jgi:hypothetical protein
VAARAGGRGRRRGRPRSSAHARAPAGQPSWPVPCRRSGAPWYRRAAPQYLTCCAGCCFRTAEKWDAIFSRRRSFAAADVAAAIAPPTALSKNPADAQASVNPSKLKAAVARRSRRCDRWRRSAPKSCLQAPGEVIRHQNCVRAPFGRRSGVPFQYRLTVSLLAWGQTARKTR